MTADGPLTLADLAAPTRRDGSPLAGLPAAAITALAGVFAHNFAIAGTITGRIYHGDMLFFAATWDRPGTVPGPAAWQPHVTGRVLTHQVAAAHGAMMQRAALASIGPLLAAHLSPAARPA